MYSIVHAEGWVEFAARVLHTCLQCQVKSWYLHYVQRVVWSHPQLDIFRVLYPNSDEEI